MNNKEWRKPAGKNINLFDNLMLLLRRNGVENALSVFLVHQQTKKKRFCKKERKKGKSSPKEIPRWIKNQTYGVFVFVCGDFFLPRCCLENLKLFLSSGLLPSRLNLKKYPQVLHRVRVLKVTGLTPWAHARLLALGWDWSSRLWSRLNFVPKPATIILRLFPDSQLSYFLGQRSGLATRPSLCILRLIV